MRSRCVGPLAVGCLLVGCAVDPELLSVEAEDAAAPVDAQPIDAPGPLDAGAGRDGSTDRGGPDAASLDAGARDAGSPDAGRDAGSLDAGRDAGGRDAGLADAGARDAGSPNDVGAAPDVGSLPSAGVALPAWDAATVAHVREVRARGASMGNRLAVFAKIGDSITESGSFLSDVGFGWVDLGAYGALAPTIAYFSQTRLGGADINSFNRASVCATAGWTTGDALAGGSSAPLRRELAAIHPAWAIVMYGTNDLDRGTVATFTTNLNTIVDVAEAAGTVVALSTIPDRNDGAGPAAAALRFNDAIRGVTAARHIPLLDYWASMQPLPSRGVSSDEIHPSVYLAGGSTAPGYFTATGLRYGYNMRNLTAIQMLERMRSLP